MIDSAHVFASILLTFSLNSRLEIQYRKVAWSLKGSNPRDGKFKIERVAYRVAGSFPHCESGLGLVDFLLIRWRMPWDDRECERGLSRWELKE